MENKGKVLVVLTNIEQYGDDPEQTGLWLAEATEFVAEVTQAGYQVDYVSPQGGTVPIDPRSLKKWYVTEEDFDLIEETRGHLRSRLSGDLLYRRPRGYLGFSG